MMKSLKSANLKLSFSISPMTRWILTILILGIGIVLVVVLYSQEQSKNSKLQDQVDSAASTLVQNTLTSTSLQGDLANANLNMAQLQAQMPSSGQTMTIEEALYGAAADAGVTLSNVSVTEAKKSKDSVADYNAYRATICLAGDYQNQLRFVGVLGYWLPSSDIVSVSSSGEGVSVVVNIYVL